MLDLCRIFRCAWFRWYDSAAIPDWLWRRSRVIVSEGLCRSGHQRISMLRITLVHFELWECQGWTSKRDTVLSSWTSGRPPDSVMDFRLNFEEGQAWLFVKLTSYTWQSQCRSRHQRRSVLRVTADKSNIHLCEGQGWTSKKPHGAFMLDFWKTARFRHGFPTDFWRRPSATVLRRLHLTPDKVNADQDIRESQNISKKSHGALMLNLCRIFHYAWFRWYDSAAIPDWLWRRSRVIVSEGLFRSGHQRISMLRIT